MEFFLSSLTFISMVFTRMCLQRLHLLFILLPLPSEQLIIYQVGVLPSHFYNVLADKDYPGFRSLVATAMVLIITNSTVS